MFLIRIQFWSCCHRSLYISQRAQTISPSLEWEISLIECRRLRKLAWSQWGYDPRSCSSPCCSSWILALHGSSYMLQLASLPQHFPSVCCCSHEKRHLVQGQDFDWTENSQNSEKGIDWSNADVLGPMNLPNSGFIKPVVLGLEYEKGKLFWACCWNWQVNKNLLYKSPCCWLFLEQIKTNAQ